MVFTVDFLSKRRVRIRNEKKRLWNICCRDIFIHAWLRKRFHCPRCQESQPGNPSEGVCNLITRVIVIHSIYSVHQGASTIPTQSRHNSNIKTTQLHCCPSRPSFLAIHTTRKLLTNTEHKAHFARRARPQKTKGN